MTLGFGPIRRNLIFLLTIAMAVSVWPSLDLTRIEHAGLGHSLPWQADQSTNTNAIIESLVEIDPAEGSACDGRKMWLANFATRALLGARAQHIARDGFLPYPKRRTLFPNKTGPPAA